MAKITNLILLFSIISIIGCTEEKQISTLPASHPSSWIDANSNDFHGHVVMDRGSESCVVCHGNDFDGGDSDVSCIDCHIAKGACVSCHGGADNKSGAPPKGLRGESETTELAVGAHTAHLETTISAPIECKNCHVVPVSIIDSLHLDLHSESMDSIAELNFSAFPNYLDAIWNRDSATCSDLYCHGNFNGGKKDNKPVWTSKDQAVCGSCHDIGGDPATLGWKHELHVGTIGINCEKCHGAVINDLMNFEDISLHVNGVADTIVTDTAFCNTCHGPNGGGCNLCHGGTDNQTGAPPQGLRGETATTELAVGAHTIHLEGGSQADSFNCETCHIVPSSFNDVGHLANDSIAELTWSGMAGVSSNWNRVNAECNNTYCHGNFDGGNKLNSPTWTGGTSEATCGSCHDVGSNPATLGWKHKFHIETAGISCNKCHESVVDNSMQIIDLSLHVNGQVDTLVTDIDLCNSCHDSGSGGCTLCHGGTDNNSGAPPRGIEGETSTTDLAVGAHTIHLEGGNLSNGIDCESCHKVPISFNDVGHYDADSTAEMTWGGLSGGSSNWDRFTGECANTYCHGNFAGGNSSNNPIWNSTDQALCGSCHDVDGELKSLSGEHDKHVVDKEIECSTCHSTVVDDARTIIGRNQHVNGQVEINITAGTNATYSGGSCSNIDCHDSESWE